MSSDKKKFDFIQYYNKPENRQRILDNQKALEVCECGKNIRHGARARHCKSKQHCKKMEKLNGVEPTKEKTKMDKLLELLMKNNIDVSDLME